MGELKREWKLIRKIMEQDPSMKFVFGFIAVLLVVGLLAVIDILPYIL